MYMIVARIIAKYTAGSYASFVQDRIFTPLRMTSSTFSINKAASSGRLTQTWASIGRRIPLSFAEDSVDLLAGAGGVISTAEDMVTF